MKWTARTRRAAGRVRAGVLLVALLAGGLLPVAGDGHVAAAPSALPAGYEVVTNAHAANVTPGLFVTSRVACPAGKVLLGGGVRIEPPVGDAQFLLGQNGPESRTSWISTIGYHGTQTFGTTYFTYLICVNDAPQIQLVTEVTDINISVRTSSVTWVTCPQDTVIAGGGSVFEDIRPAGVGVPFLFESSPHGQRGWVNGFAYTQGAPGTFRYRSAAICVAQGFLAGYQLVQERASASLPPGGLAVGRPNCPAGKRTLGGGLNIYDLNPNNRVPILPIGSDGPNTAATDQWFVSLTNQDTISYDVVFYTSVVCVS
jgi:hypothetical protein